jgi:hypothetical protein
VSECNLHCTFVFQYIHPADAHKLGQAELLVIDEAAAIPLPYVKSMLGPYLVFLASTINGSENSLELRTSQFIIFLLVNDFTVHFGLFINQHIATVNPLKHSD